MNPGSEELLDGPLLGDKESQALESYSRRHPGIGGEPTCPRCETAMVRRVERYPAPRSDSSPFRVRLDCPHPECRAWTLFNW